MGKTTKWQSSWDNEADENGDLFGDYLIKQVGDCETRIADLSEQLLSFQRKLAKLCEKKPKGKE